MAPFNSLSSKQPVLYQFRREPHTRCHLKLQFITLNYRSLLPSSQSHRELFSPCSNPTSHLLRTTMKHHCTTPLHSPYPAIDSHRCFQFLPPPHLQCAAPQSISTAQMSLPVLSVAAIIIATALPCCAPSARALQPPSLQSYRCSLGSSP
ncbi:hypothetical protein M0R45_001561 [Rubus argutus]|uniref:Uncharacterized protein n=1 Tax=Rubus argutus TaxID=59490 RepID=A0AAW1VJL9_RUBAR